MRIKLFIISLSVIFFSLNNSFAISLDVGWDQSGQVIQTLEESNYQLCDTDDWALQPFNSFDIPPENLGYLRSNVPVFQLKKKCYAYWDGGLLFRSSSGPCIFTRGQIISSYDDLELKSNRDGQTDGSYTYEKYVPDFTNLGSISSNNYTATTKEINGAEEDCIARVISKYSSSLKKLGLKRLKKIEFMDEKRNTFSIEVTPNLRISIYSEHWMTPEEISAQLVSKKDVYIGQKVLKIISVTDTALLDEDTELYTMQTLNNNFWIYPGETDSRKILVNIVNPNNSFSADLH